MEFNVGQIQTQARGRGERTMQSNRCRDYEEEMKRMNEKGVTLVTRMRRDQPDSDESWPIWPRKIVL